jgi:lipopolysaccharide/colanic/teichoic acid biosynthesis glycosyltransferase
MFVRAGYLPWKRVIDAATAAVLLFVTAPLLLVLAGLVRLTSRGPAFHAQDRLGRFGRFFRMWKLRTMTIDGEVGAGAPPGRGGDPRLTEVGRLLRFTRLSELPQLWNVLRGDMSLIGPRPERPEFMPILEASIPNYRQRLLARPGLTGLAQVYLPPDTGIPSMRKKIKYDLYYIREMSAGLDLRLLLAWALQGMCLSKPLVLATLRLPPAARIEQLPAVDVSPERLAETPILSIPQPFEAEPKVTV